MDRLLTAFVIALLAAVAGLWVSLACVGTAAGAGGALFDTPANVHDFAVWKGARPSPVTIYYDPGGELWPVPDSLIVAVLDEWNAVTPNFRYVYGGRVTPGYAYANNTCATMGPTGLNTISWFPVTGLSIARACIWSTSFECDVQLDTTGGAVMLNPESLRVILLHEEGHCLGLAHSDVPGAVMQATLTTQTHLSADDIAGVCSLYGGCSPRPPTPPATVRPSPTPTASPTRTPTPRPKPRLPQLARDN